MAASYERAGTGGAGVRPAATSRALWLPTGLLLLAVALIAQLVLAGPPPVAVWASTATPAPMATATATLLIEATRDDAVDRGPYFRPPVCRTPDPGATCVTSLPSCTVAILKEPDRLCRWLAGLPEAYGGS